MLHVVFALVPGMLEFESIPGVVSTLRRFKNERKNSEEIITVKDITNKVNFDLLYLFFLWGNSSDFVVCSIPTFIYLV